MKAAPTGVRFVDLRKVREHFFGPARKSGTRHAVFKTPWPGDPRVNIQGHKGKAKAYQVRQVRQVLEAVAKSKEQRSEH